MKNNQIQKAQFGAALKRIWNALKNSAQVAQIAEAPSVMTASGWRVDGNGKAVQDQQNSPAVKQLRDYFGLKEGENLTPEMWDFAKRHYLTDVQHNNGTLTMFNNTANSRSSEFPLFLQWLNKRAPVIGGITTGGLIFNTLNNGNNN